ncbi:MAG TPA: pseudouridine synthase [Verrucomicrobiae bacterium]|nr:pseudouridine synthase [Verrucomicrobiae bacterium]
MKTRRAGPATGLARALSKLGYCSRSEAWELVKAGRATLNGRVQRDPETRVNLGRDQIAVDGRPVGAAEKAYLMLNKPRGLVTTASDEQGRDTVFQCFTGQNLPRLSAVGRLDMASEGLLLFTNDNAWAARITAPERRLEKTYHVQINRVADDALAAQLSKGIQDEGDWLAAKRASVLRTGEKNSWLEIVLDEGKNRHIRRLLGALEIEVLRLVRVAIGPLPLGDLPKGKWRALTQEEIRLLGGVE